MTLYIHKLRQQFSLEKRLRGKKATYAIKQFWRSKYGPEASKEFFCSGTKNQISRKCDHLGVPEKKHKEIFIKLDIPIERCAENNINRCSTLKKFGKMLKWSFMYIENAHNNTT